MIALIDGDLVVYQNAFRAESAVDFGDGQLLATANTSVAIAEADAQLERITEEVGADRFVIALTDPVSNFRKAVWPDYKRPRKTVKRPLAYTAVRDYLMEKYECIVRPSLEADDVLGILATGKVKGFSGDKVICSTDKDLLSVPAKVYNWSYPGRGIVESDELAADFRFYMQTLTGDAADHYPGCPSIGPTRAERILKEADHLWSAVVGAFEAKGLTEADAIVQARCARILRASDYDFKTKEVKLWTPKK